MMKYLVTGSNGFIGSRMAALLRHHGHEVIEFDKDSSFDPVDVIGHVDKVYHFAANSNTTVTDLSDILDNNISLTQRIIEECEKQGKFVAYASSASVYGNSRNMRTLSPLNLYAMSKAIIDQWVLDNKFQWACGYRLFNVYGYGEHNKGSQASPITQFTLQAVRDGVINLFEGSEIYIRDFIHVGDVVNFMYNDVHVPGVMDVGTTQPVSFQHVADVIAKRVGADIQHVPMPRHLMGKYQYYTESSELVIPNAISVDQYVHTSEYQQLIQFCRELNNNDTVAVKYPAIVK